MFVVMPNHVHVIFAFVGATLASPNSAKPGPKPRSLGAIIGSFKSAVTKRVNEFHNLPGATFWQRNYYEHVIRNERELNLISQYIISNPLQWAIDRENPASNAKPDRDEIAEILNDDSRRGDACVAPTIDNDDEKKELFTSLIHEVTLITRTQDNPDAALQTVCGLLRKKVPHYDWVGFYLTDPNVERQLILGPFAGALPGLWHRLSSLCAKLYPEQVREPVPHALTFCNNMIVAPQIKGVLPILNEDEVLGELDIDSHTIDAFSEEDRAFLLKVCCAVSRLLYRVREARGVYDRITNKNLKEE